jgi:ABC-type multidrug transport system fused ATPase/permease subunit
VGLADIVGLGSMVPVLMLSIDHSFLEKSRKLRYIFDLFGFQSEGYFLKVLIILILLFFVIKSLIAIAVQRYIRRTSIDIANTISSHSFESAFKNNTYEKITSDGLGFNDAVLFTPYYFVSGIFLPFINIITETFISVMLILVFTLYNPSIIFLIVGLLGTAFVLVNRFTRNRITNLGEKASIDRENALQGLNFGISGFADIRTHGVENYFKNRFLKDFNRFVQHGVKAVNYQLIPARINEFVSLVGIVLLVIYAYFYSGENLGQVRVLAALFAISVFRLIPAANRILQALMHLKMNAYTIEKLLPVSANNTNVNKKSIHTFSDSIELKNIQFCYNEKTGNEIFKDLNLVIKKGQFIGISGKSGIGKTTLAKLLLGFYKPTEGAILIDGKPVDVFTELHPLYSYMGQEPFIINGSISDNIALGIEPEERNESLMRSCLAQANLIADNGEDILNWDIGDKGSKLSEGQKKRLILARELYRDAEIMILDEPTSALDAETEKTLLENLKLLKAKGKTILIVAHRERIFEICDFVCEIKHKRLIIKE